jgi:hypothetical protein
MNELKYKIIDRENDSAEKFLSMIDSTGLYYRHHSKAWELWYVDPETNEKSLIGFSSGKMGKRYAALLLEDFHYLVDYEISGISDILDEGEYAQ